ATWVERRALAAAAEAGRPRCLVHLIDEPVAAAAGAGFDRVGGRGGLSVDGGGGSRESAVVTGGHLVRAESLRLGGNAMDEAIVAAVKAELGLLIGRNAARRLKMALGLTGGTAGTPEWAEAVGVDVMRGTPRAERIPGELVADALEPCVSTIVEGVREILLDLPPDLAEDVVLGKICLAGGGALLLGLAGRGGAGGGGAGAPGLGWWPPWGAASPGGRPTPSTGAPFPAASRAGCGLRGCVPLAIPEAASRIGKPGDGKWGVQVTAEPIDATVPP